MPMRCPEPLRQVYRLVAARHPSVVLVDGPRVLEAKSRHGFTDGRFFHDAQHPNLEGYVALAEDLMIQLRAHHAFGWPEEKPVPAIDAEACARHFELSAAQWAEICNRDQGFFRASAYIRFDPKFRNERAAEYLRAADAIRAGRLPADAGIPGWPMPPPPAKSHRIPVRGGRQPWMAFSVTSPHHFSRQPVTMGSRADARTGFALPCAGRVSRIASVVSTRRRPTAAA